MNARLVALVAALGAGCAGSKPAGLAPEPQWVSTLHRDHPLSGGIWEVSGSRFVTEAELESVLRRAQAVVLGETHDNPDHHVLQGRLLDALSTDRLMSNVVLEMIDTRKQDALDAAARSGSSDAIREAVEWEKTSWPRFAIYKPIFDVAVRRGRRLVAAGLPRDEARAVIAKGEAGLPPEIAQLFAKEGPPSPETLAAVREEMKTSHCGQLPDSMLDGMALVQRVRDALLAERAGSSIGGSVIIAGAGHARKDRGAPAHLRVLRPDLTAVSVGLVEVLPSRREPRQYAADYGTAKLPFDYVIFTPATERDDPCKKLQQQRKP